MSGTKRERVTGNVTILRSGTKHDLLPVGAVACLVANFREGVPVLRARARPSVRDWYLDEQAGGWVKALREVDGDLVATVELEPDLARLLDSASPFRLSPEMLAKAYDECGAEIGPWLLCLRIVPGFRGPFLAMEPETSAATQPPPEGQELRIGHPDACPRCAEGDRPQELTNGFLGHDWTTDRWRYCRNGIMRSWMGPFPVATPNAEAHPLPPHDCEEGSD